MPTPFLMSFSTSVLHHLLDEEEIILCGPLPDVIAFVAFQLGNPKAGRSLISSLSAALLACPDVEELFANDETLKQMVTELPRTDIRRGTT